MSEALAAAAAGEQQVVAVPVEMEVLVESLEAGAAGGDFEMHEVEEQQVPPPL